ncbi:MAG: hypothetical protein JRI97_00550 [Deltaproteobacteria bacterium]|nr:hypothetical protein [Deltaproteobacteria bacterium]
MELMAVVFGNAFLLRRAAKPGGRAGNRKRSPERRCRVP